jgi:predicted MPP superfamily phosphohydrolase
MNWLYSGAFVLFALSLLSVFWNFRLKLLLLPIFSWALAGWGVWNGIRLPEIEALEFQYADLPKELEGYRIAHISDLHVTTAARRWRTEGVVDRVNALKADLICITGDMMDGDPVRFKSFIEPISRLKAKDGVYACTGNHEFYHRFYKWLPIYESWGIRFLRDEAAFPRPSLALAGVDDKAGNAFRRDALISPDVARAFAKAGEGRFRLLMEHRPGNAADNMARHGVDLQLSGHTHGGVLPVLSLLVAKWNNGFTRGVYDFPSGGRLYVSPGSGQWAGFPVRFFNPSVITVITLRSK